MTETNREQYEAPIFKYRFKQWFLAGVVGLFFFAQFVLTALTSIHWTGPVEAKFATLRPSLPERGHVCLELPWGTLEERAVVVLGQYVLAPLQISPKSVEGASPLPGAISPPAQRKCDYIFNADGQLESPKP